MFWRKHKNANRIITNEESKGFRDFFVYVYVEH